MILGKIVAAKKEEVFLRKRKTSLAELKKALFDLPPPRDFMGALSGKECVIIAEIKRRSPSRGILRQDFNHRALASVYEDCGAAAVSVLTDEEFFGGHATYLSHVRKTVSIPLLRKDFIIDRYQIYETRVLGGDALLLIAGILEPQHLREFIDLTKTLGMAALVEIHSAGELEKAHLAGATLIGINNRDLKTFSTDLDVSLRLSRLVPPDKILVSESGIHTRGDVEKLLNAGIHAFLIGETLMRASDISEKMNELLGRKE
jgi:indole-3-glycerol phosphate synthase